MKSVHLVFTKTELRDHIRSVHENNPYLTLPYRCNRCDNKTGQSAKMQTHLAGHANFCDERKAYLVSVGTCVFQPAACDENTGHCRLLRSDFIIAYKDGRRATSGCHVVNGCGIRFLFLWKEHNIWMKYAKKFYGLLRNGV